MPNLVETALIEYIQERQDKQGILLTPEGGYYLYGGQFCPTCLLPPMACACKGHHPFRWTSSLGWQAECCAGV